MDRRQFLTGTAAALAATIAPLPAMPGGMTIGVDMAAGPDLLAFAVGTPDEMDWQPVFARNAEEAFQAYLDLWGHAPEDAPGRAVDDHVTRCPQWDGKSAETITPADWIWSDAGYSCSECGAPAYALEGAMAVGTDAVCCCCANLGHRLIADREAAIEELADLIAQDGLPDVRRFVEREGFDVPADIWAEAIGRAA